MPCDLAAYKAVYEDSALGKLLDEHNELTLEGGRLEALVETGKVRAENKSDTLARIEFIAERLDEVYRLI